MVAMRRWIWAPLAVSIALALGAAPVSASGSVSVSIQSPAAGATVFGNITVSGTASAKYGVSSVAVAVDSGRFQPASLSGSSWTFALNTNNLANGSHTIAARATDTRRNTTTASIRVTVNNTPPSISIASPEAGATIVGTFTITGTASSPAAGLSTVQVRVDANAWTTATGTTSWSASINSAAYADGAHTVFAMATDSAGHATSASVAVTFSNTPPTVTITSPPPGTVQVGAFTVSGTASSAAVSVSSVQVRVDSNGWMAAIGTTSWSASINSIAYADGSHTIFAMATDSVGHASTTSVALTFSNTPPTLTITSPASGAVVAGSATVSGTASSTAGLASVQVRVDSGAWTSSPNTGNWSVIIDTTAYPDGAHTIYAMATDSVGRTATSSVSVTVSNAPPTVAITSPQAGATVAGMTNVSGTAGSSAGISSVQVQVDANPPVTAAGGSQWSASIDTTTLANGQHTLTATATDTLGRSSSASITVTVSNNGLIVTHQSPWFIHDSTGNVSTVNETMTWDGNTNQSSLLPTGTITFQVNSTIQPNDANPADTCTQDLTTGYWSCVHTIQSADLQWQFVTGWSLHYAFQLQVEYPPTSTFTISYSGDSNFNPSSAQATYT